jgi:hypothetical protein
MREGGYRKIRTVELANLRTITALSTFQLHFLPDLPQMSESERAFND